MDKEQARFILQSFRPDGADAKDPDFAEALAVAAEDRELGDWLAAERALPASISRISQLKPVLAEQRLVSRNKPRSLFNTGFFDIRR